MRTIGRSLRNGICRGDDNEAQRFILLPPEGMWWGEQRGRGFTGLLFSLLASHVERGVPIGIDRTTELRHEVDELSDRGLILPLAVIPPPRREIDRGATEQFGGPTLAELDAEALLVLRRVPYWVRVVPEQPISVMTSMPAHVPARAPTGTTPVTVEVQDVRGNPIPDAEVQAFTDLRLNLGDIGVTNAAGTTILDLGGSGSVIERLYVRADRAAYRGHYAANVTVGAGSRYTVVLNDVDTSVIDCLRYHYSSSVSDGAGVRIGLIDTGVDNTHPDLNIAGGRNTVVGEPPSSYGDNGTSGHGTHLAGIIAANPTSANRPMGLAPTASVFSYRIFGQGVTRAQGSFAILRAVIQSLDQDGCHLLNMSFGPATLDAVFTEMDQFIWEYGALAFAAAGNTNRGGVTLPAALAHVAAVGAVGRKHTYPPGSLEESDELGKFGADPDDYTAAFSPDSLEVQLAAPGVGVMSTLPGGRWGPWSGTSQASAAATGRAAALLSGSFLLSEPANSRRAAGLWNNLFANLRLLDVGLTLEGGGILQ